MNSMKVLFLQNCETEEMGIYEEYLKEHGIDYEIFPAYLGKRFPAIKNFSAIIVGGTAISVYHLHKYPFLQKEWKYLQKVIELNKPYLGICFGGQLLARLLGAEVNRSPRIEIGGYEVILTSAGQKNKFFQEFPRSFQVFHWHNDTFEIPRGAKLLVEGKECKNQAFSYKQGLALQFHLEVTAREAEKWAIKYKNELKIVGKTKTRVVNECRRSEKVMKRMAYLLLDNFFETIISKPDHAERKFF
jgi:GMP synthase (glutamine-hydrolysing)